MGSCRGTEHDLYTRVLSGLSIALDMRCLHNLLGLEAYCPEIWFRRGFGPETNPKPASRLFAEPYVVPFRDLLRGVRQPAILRSSIHLAKSRQMTALC